MFQFHKNIPQTSQNPQDNLHGLTKTQDNSTQSTYNTNQAKYPDTHSITLLIQYQHKKTQKSHKKTTKNFSPFFPPVDITPPHTKIKPLKSPNSINAKADTA